LTDLLYIDSANRMLL